MYVNANSEHLNAIKHFSEETAGNTISVVSATYKILKQYAKDWGKKSLSEQADDTTHLLRSVVSDNHIKHEKLTESLLARVISKYLFVLSIVDKNYTDEVGENIASEVISSFRNMKYSSAFVDTVNLWIFN